VGSLTRCIASPISLATPLSGSPAFVVFLVLPAIGEPRCRQPPSVAHLGSQRGTNLWQNSWMVKQGILSGRNRLHQRERPFMVTEQTPYAARLDIDYPEELNRLKTFFRLILAIPILIILAIISASADSTYVVVSEAGNTITRITTTSGGIAGALFVATLLLILFRQRYPRWWFDFAREFARFAMRVGAYLALLTDQYPSTEDEQTVHLEVDYPDVKQDLNRWLPLVKWFLVIPHFIVLFFLAIGAVFAVIIAWFAILFTGRYPRGLFDYVVGVSRWVLRVEAYAALLVTDRYPPFSLS
jgi:hypothetical protein